MQRTDFDPTQAACASYPALFAAEALSYNPDGEDYQNLTAHEHAEMTIKRERMEKACKFLCMGCPMLFQCETNAMENEVYGVAAGMTAAERRTQSPTEIVSEPVVDIRDRSFRNRVNDDAVGVFTRQGWTNEQIAQELECTTRTVARSRARMRDNMDEITVEQVLSAVPYVPVSAQATSRVSDAMLAIYGVLADGQWHDREELLAVAMPLVPAAEALETFNRKNPTNTHTPTDVRIAKGAREKANNALSASCRVRGRTERQRETGAYRVTNKSTAQVVREVA